MNLQYDVGQTHIHLKEKMDQVGDDRLLWMLSAFQMLLSLLQSLLPIEMQEKNLFSKRIKPSQNASGAFKTGEAAILKKKKLSHYRLSLSRQLQFLEGRESTFWKTLHFVFIIQSKQECITNLSTFCKY